MRETRPEAAPLYTASVLATQRSVHAEPRITIPLKFQDLAPFTCPYANTGRAYRLLLARVRAILDAGCHPSIQVRDDLLDCVGCGITLA